MKGRIAFFFGMLLIGLSAVAATTATNQWKVIEPQVLAEMNLARTNPAAFAAALEKTLPEYEGLRRRRGANVFIETKEGKAALLEAIQFLRQTKPLPALVRSSGMSLGAADHARDQSGADTVGHSGADGSDVSSRVNRYGKWQKVVGENISYGYFDARSLVANFIIDDGVPDRGHRKNLFNPAFKVCGIACNSHPTYRTIGVVTLASGYAERPATR